jgi:hypothetical protein
MNLRPTEHMLSSNSYYTYTALALLVPLLYAAWQGVGRAGRLATPARNCLTCGLLVLAFAGGEQVRRLNTEMRPPMREMERPIHAVNQFVKKHRYEPDFSIAIDYDSSDHVPKAYGVPVTHVIFFRWIVDEPKYWIAIRGGKPVVVPPPRPAAPPEVVRLPEPEVAPDSPLRPGVGRTSQRVGGLASRPGGGE